jgi:hypothetical protein
MKLLTWPKHGKTENLVLKWVENAVILKPISTLLSLKASLFSRISQSGENKEKLDGKQIYHCINNQIQIIWNIFQLVIH